MCQGCSLTGFGTATGKAFKMNSNEIASNKIAEILGDKDSIEFDINDPLLDDVNKDIHKARVRLALTQRGIVLEFDKALNRVKLSRIDAAKGTTTDDIPERVNQKGKPKPKPKRYEHTYYPPAIAKDMLDILVDDGSHILWLTGPTQCGKSVLVRYLAGELNMVTHQINCRGDMGSDSFFGEKTVRIDEETGQNFVEFERGIVPTAMVEGLDDDGNEVGPAGLLFVDEAAALMPHVAIALNRMMESDDPRRTLVIDQDGAGTVVRSHSKFRIVFAANNVGRGATDLNTAAYTAQHDALDISLLNRVTAAFRMGYDRRIERKILQEKIGDDVVTGKVIRFRDAIRDHIRAGKLSSPFSTQHLVGISDLYRIFGDLAKAIYYSTFEFLLPGEKAVYNETVTALIGTDVLAEFEDEYIDYM